MHLHSVLMLVSVAVIWAFCGVVIAVTWLQRRGRLGPAEARMPFSSYGPVMAGTASGGAAAAHLVTVTGHARELPTTDGAVAFICSIGAGTHFQTVDAGVAGYLPLGVLSIALVVAQVAWTAPRLWRAPQLAVVGASIGMVSLLAAFDRWTFRAPAGSGATVSGIAYSDVLAMVFEVGTIALVGMLVARRPRRLVDRLTLKVADAWIGTGLAVSAVLAFSVSAVVVGTTPH